MPFPFADGIDSPVLDELIGGPAAALTAVALVVAPGARASGWGARAAAALAARWPGPRRVLLADLDLDRPTLHEEAGIANDEGVIDLIEYGISVGRLIGPGGAGAYDVLPAGSFTPDPGAILRHDGWSRVLLEVAARRGTLLAWVPSDADGVEAVVERAGAVLVLAEAGEAREVVERLPHPYAVLGIITPAVAPLMPEPPATEDDLADPEVAPAETVGAGVDTGPAHGVDGTEATEAAALAGMTGDAESAAIVGPTGDATPAAIAGPTAAEPSPIAGPADEEPAAAGPTDEPAVVARPTDHHPAAADEAREQAIIGGAVEAEALDSLEIGAREAEQTAVAGDLAIGTDTPGTAAGKVFVSAAPPASAAPEGPSADRTVSPADERAARIEEELEERLETDPSARDALAHEIHARQRAARLAGATHTAPGIADAGVVASAGAQDTAASVAAHAADGDTVATDAGASAVAEEQPPKAGPRYPAQAAPPRHARSRYRRPVLWTVGVVFLASLLAGAWHFLSGPPDPEEPPAAVTPPEPAAPAAPMAANALPFVVAIEAHREMLVALNRVSDLSEIEPQLLFHVEPLERDGTMFYHVMAGPVADSTAALALRDTLIARGHKTGATPTDVRATPLAFLIGDYGTPESAEEQNDILRRLDIPGYVLQGTAADSAPLYRLYVGGFSTAAEAAIIRQMLQSAGIRDSLVTRTGSVMAADFISTEGDSVTAGDSLATTNGQQ